MYCKNEHESHDNIDLIQFKNSYESNHKLEEKIKNITNKINNLEEIKNKIIDEIDKFKKIYDLEIKFLKVLFSTFKYEESQNNINYNIIENIKSYDETFELYKMKKLDKIIKESNKFISLFQTIGLQKSYKTLTNHTSYVFYLLKLKDGRLASCSADKTLKIYSKDEFEVQLSISLHSGYIYYITQLNNENILTCSCDNTMIIIKLIGDNKYNLEQQLIGHSNIVVNAIEIKDNKLISVSYDNTMKIWNLNNNKYECINTIKFQNSNNFAFIYKLNENEFVIFSYVDKCLKFWNSYDYSNISTINNIEGPHKNNFNGQICEFDDDILGFGGFGFYLIKISTHQLIKKITMNLQIHSVYKCLDGLFLCLIYTGYRNKILVKYKYKNHNLNKIIEKVEPFPNISLSNCIELDDERLVTAHVNFDDYILIWYN